MKTLKYLVIAFLTLTISTKASGDYISPQDNQPEITDWINKAPTPVTVVAINMPWLCPPEIALRDGNNQIQWFFYKPGHSDPAAVLIAEKMNTGDILRAKKETVPAPYPTHYTQPAEETLQPIPPPTSSIIKIISPIKTKLTKNTTGDQKNENPTVSEWLTEATEPIRIASLGEEDYPKGSIALVDGDRNIQWFIPNSKNPDGLAEELSRFGKVDQKILVESQPQATNSQK